MGLVHEDDIVSDSAPPAWSGVPIGPEQSSARCRDAGDEIVVIPLHVSDTRHIMVPGYEHVSVRETEGGDVEYHTFRRLA